MADTSKSLRRVACLTCRSIKARCLPKLDEEPFGICQRCDRLKHECVYHYDKYGSVKRSAVFASGSAVPAAVELDVSRHLDPDLPPAVAVDAGDGANDPVRLQHLSSLEAESLYSNFMHYLNPIIAILDKDCESALAIRADADHTLDMIRRSALLTTAIFAASAKFFQPDLYAHLSSHAQMLLNRAISQGTCNIAVVKSIAIMVFWKEPTDKSAYVKIGIAIRLGFQLGLHLPPTGKTHHDEDKKRTWYCLSCADRAYSEMFTLPISITMDHLSEITTTPTRHRLSVDSHLACSMALVSPHLLWLRAKRLELTGLSKRLILDDVSERFHHHLVTWFPSENHSYMSTVEHRFLRFIDLIEMLRLRYELLDCCAPSEQADILLQCLDWSTQIADQTDLVAESGILVYLQDTSASRLTTYGMILHKLYSRFSPTNQQIVVTLLRRVLQRCTGVGDMTATAFVARFLRRCLNNIAASRPPSPPPAEPLHDAFFDIRDFLQDTPNSHMDAFDAEYWATLFAAPPDDFVFPQ